MKKDIPKLVFLTVVITMLLIMAGVANAQEPYPLVEEFDSSEGFTSTSPDITISNGELHWSVSRSPAGYRQYISRSIPAFTGDVRLTVRGKVDGYNNNAKQNRKVTNTIVIDLVFGLLTSNIYVGAVM